MNLNDKVSVTLTAAGAATLNARSRESNAMIGKPGAFKTTHAEGDEHHTQMWVLMETFGSSISMVSPTPFKGNEVRLDP